MNEILKKRIEEGMADYADNLYPKYFPQHSIARAAFSAGAEYALSHQWISVEEALPDRIGYDWVLIQIQFDNGFMCAPKIGEIRIDGYWHCADYDEFYKIGESFEEKVGCKVIAWMPIPKFETEEKKGKR